MKFTVKGVRLVNDNVVSLSLEGRREDVKCFTSDICLRIPVEELPLYYLGRELELELPQLPPFAGSTIDDIEEVVESVTAQ